MNRFSATSLALFLLVWLGCQVYPSWGQAQTQQAQQTQPKKKQTQQNKRAKQPRQALYPNQEREEEMFGAGAALPSDDADKGAVSTTSSDREEDMFGTQTPSANTQGGFDDDALLNRLAQNEDWLTIGADLYMRFQYLVDDQADFDDAQISSPSLFQLYLDGRPNDRVRVYVRGRMNFDFTLVETLSDPVSDDDQNAGAVDLFWGRPEALNLSLDQFFLKFDILRTLYVTLGRQPVRWGSGRFWNPTDFLNQQRRDPLTIFDQRLGAGLVRLHLPIESLGWNFYAVANLEGASSINNIGAALRGEFLFETTELALSLAARKDQPLRLGADISTALGDFDIRVECALLHDKDRPTWQGQVDYEALALLVASGQEEELTQELARLTGTRENEWIPQISAGAEISFLYSEQDSLIVGAEYFFNDLGYTDASYYLLMLLQNEFTPFYLGRHYASAYLVLMQPGSWNNTNFTLSAIANLSDKSWLTRFDYRVRILTYLDLAAFAAVHLGDQGEMRFGLDLGPVVVPAPWLDFGLWMILRI